jgi:ketosteroid isomerase-like protein
MQALNPITEQNQMRGFALRSLVCFAAVMLFAGLAFASDPTEVMKPVHQFVDGFNKGDAKSALAACASEAYILDEFPPYEWHGANACSVWADAYAADAKKNGITDGVVTLGKPKHVDVSGDHAYVVVPASYAFERKGTPMKEANAMMTLTLQKSASGWQITAWSWSKE